MKHIQFKFNDSFNDIDTLILPITDQSLVSDRIPNLPQKEALAQLAAELHASGDFSGKTGKTLLLVKPSGLNIQRLLLVGLGDTAKLTVKSYLTCLSSAANALDHCGAIHIINALVHIQPDECTLEWSVYQNAQVFQRSFYDWKSVV